VNYLQAEYFAHFCLLIKTIFLLLQQSISPHDLHECSSLLRKFCIQTHRLYGQRYSTYNVHNLLHMVHSVKQLGPLWAQSSFWYEDFNGDFKHLFHGTQSVDYQIVCNTIIQHKIPEIARTLVSGTTGYTLYHNMTVNYHKAVKITGHEIANSMFTVGVLTNANIESKDKAVIYHRFPKIKDIKQFKRVCFNGLILQSKSYSRVIKRNSYTICYNGKFGTCYGFVKYYLQVFDGDKFEYLAVIDLPKIEENLFDLKHLLKIGEDSTTIDVCKVTDINELCCFVSFKSQNFIAKFPNKIEKD